MAAAAAARCTLHRCVPFEDMPQWQHWLRPCVTTQKSAPMAAASTWCSCRQKAQPSADCLRLTALHRFRSASMQTSMHVWPRSRAKRVSKKRPCAMCGSGPIWPVLHEEECGIGITRALRATPCPACCCLSAEDDGAHTGIRASTRSGNDASTHPCIQTPKR